MRAGQPRWFPVCCRTHEPAWELIFVAKLSLKEREWVEARQRYGLSHALVQMARELEIIPRSLAKVRDVPAHVQLLYLERFGRSEPETVLSVENRARQEQREIAMEKLRYKLAKKRGEK
jgi:hypothetical protein